LWCAANGPLLIFPNDSGNQLSLANGRLSGAAALRGISTRSFQELLPLANEGGAKSIILRSRKRVAEVKFPEGEIDIDTREDWEELNGGSASSETMPKGRRRRKVNYADGKR